MNLLWICFLLTTGDVSGGPDQPLSCGQSSGYLLASRLGRDVTLEQFDPEFLNKGPESSLSDLQRALQAFSVNTVAWNVAWVDFQRIQGPMICHLASSGSDIRHFHVAEWRAGELWILDPLATHPIRITAEMVPQYQKSFSGRVLVPINAVPWTWRVFGTGRGIWLGGLGLSVLIMRRFWLHRRRRPSPQQSLLIG